MKKRIRKLVVERESLKDNYTDTIISGLPESNVIITDNISDYVTDDCAGTLYLKRNRGRFIKDFPSSSSSPDPGEKYIIAMLNCPFSCRYCYLQVYLGHGRMTLFTNTEDIRRELLAELESEPPERITTGETADSLALDHITGTTESLLPFFDGTGTHFEVRTKSANIAHLLPGRGNPPQIKGIDRLVITWTMAPADGVRREEPGTASIAERLEGISKVTSAGIKAAVRFDPVIPFYYSESGYRELVGDIKKASGGSIHRFEIGIMRFPPGLWEYIRMKYPGSFLMRGEYTRAPDGKIKYYRPHRLRIYREIYLAIRDKFPDVPVELSMEPYSVWEGSGIPSESL